MTFVCNILNEEITDNIKENFDFCTMVFFLSSFIRKDLEIVLKKIDKEYNNVNENYDQLDEKYLEIQT